MDSPLRAVWKVEEQPVDAGKQDRTTCAWRRRRRAGRSPPWEAWTECAGCGGSGRAWAARIHCCA